MDWQPIETCPENTRVLLYSPYYAPHHCVGAFVWRERADDVLVSEKGNRRTYETIVTRERDWLDTLNYSVTHWQPLPAPPKEAK